MIGIFLKKKTRVIWSIVKYMVDPLTMRRLRILGDQKAYLPVFKEEGIPQSTLPPALGGSNTTKTTVGDIVREVQAASTKL